MTPFKLTAIEGLTLVTNIYASVDYDALHPFTSNRYGGFVEQEQYTTAKEKKEFQYHVDDLKLSMIDFGSKRGFPNGLFDPREPIIAFNINGRLYIGDGQHRFASAKQLGIPFYVQVVQSPFVDEFGRCDANDLDFAREYFERMNTKMSKKWTKTSTVSASARSGNPIAQYICELCEAHPLMEVSVINNRVQIKENIPSKRSHDKTRTIYKKAFELSRNASIEEINTLKDRINTFVFLCETMATACFSLKNFKSDESKERAFKKLMRNDRFTNAVYWMCNNPDRYDLETTKLIAKNSKCGQIIGASNPTQYLRAWGINYD